MNYNYANDDAPEISPPQRRANKVRKACPAAFIRVSGADSAAVVAIVALVLLGLVMVFSSSYYLAAGEKYSRDVYFFLRKQTYAAVLGFAGMIAASRFNYKNYKIFAVPFYLFALILQFLVLFLGEEYNGARRWFNAPVVGSVQPSEISKIAMVMFLSLYLSKKKENFKTWGEHLAAFLIVVSMAVLVYLGSFSAAVVIFAVGFLLIFFASPYILRFAAFGAAGVIGAGAAVLNGAAFRLDRVQAWLNPEDYSKGLARQALQSMYAIGSGGLFGLRLGQSRQKMGALSEAHNDFIFAIIVEELGFAGAVLVFVLFALLIWRGFAIAKNAVDIYGSLLAAGITMTITVQVLINIAVATNSIPTTGVPLPFISYGGTSLAITMWSAGVLLNVSRYKKKR